MEVRTETIKVRGEDDVELRVRETVHGPLISDVSSEFATVGANAPTDEPGERGSGYAVALAWTALDPAPTADAILGLNRASNWDEFRAAAADFAVPAQNLVYADREGHIGYQSPGRIPIRRSGNDGTMPVEGWISANDWTGDYIPFDGLPSVLDPEEGFIATANQAVIDENYPYLLTEGLGLRLPLDPHPRGAGRRGRAVGAGDGAPAARLDATRWPRRWCPTCSTSRTCPTATTATPRTCCATGTSPHRPTARRRRTSTWCGATCSS